MGKKYELKRVEEDVWRKTDVKIRNLKYRFSDLRDLISAGKNELEELNNSIAKKKSDIKKWEIEKRDLYSKLYNYQFNYHPSVSPTQQNGNNYQWSINLTIGDIKRKKYLGSNRNVRKRMDELTGLDTFSNALNHKGGKLNKELKDAIRKIVQGNLISEMNINPETVYDKWKKDELNMWSYLEKPESFNSTLIEK